MPSRWTIAVIVLFFAGMTGWQWYRNIGTSYGDGPQLKASLELAAQDGATTWKMQFNGQRLGTATTAVTKSPMGVYILKQNVILDGDLERFMGTLNMAAKAFGIKLNEFRVFLNTDMELTYLGTMRLMNVNFSARPRPVLTQSDLQRAEANKKDTGTSERDEAPALMQMIATVSMKDTNTLAFRGSLAIANIRIPIDEVQIKHRSKDTFLSNMAPTDCLAGIRLGQRWQTPVLDPGNLMSNALLNSKTKELTNGTFNADDMLKTKVVEMKVLDELRELDWDGQRVPCYVAQSSEKGSKMQLWVNASNYRVLKQVHESDKSLFELVRVPTKE